MKVIVEMDMPACCREYPFFYPGKRYNRCFYPEPECKLFFEGDTLAPDCPLKQCKIIEEEKIMTKHLFKVSGLDAQGKPFMGSCVSYDIIDAINMFREKHYSPHEIKQGVQMPAEHPCCIVCLRGAEESFVIAQSGVDKNLRDMQLFAYLKSKEENHE